LSIYYKVYFIEKKMIGKIKVYIPRYYRLMNWMKKKEEFDNVIFAKEKFINNRNNNSNNNNKNDINNENKNINEWNKMYHKRFK